MNKNIKFLIISLVICLIIGILIALAFVKKDSYEDKFSAIELYNLVSDSFITEGGVKLLDDDVILEFSDEEIPYLDDFVVIKANKIRNLNEIGIFKVTSDNRNDMKLIVEKYVLNLQKTYRAMDYFPEEIEKIDCATVKVFGNYVVYSFLNEHDTVVFYRAVENVIKK